MRHAVANATIRLTRTSGRSVAYGSKGDISGALGHVGIAPDNDGKSGHRLCRLSAISDLMHRSKPATLFDHLVGAAKEGNWEVEAKCLSRFEVDHKFEFGR